MPTDVAVAVEFFHHTLANGLTLIGEAMPSAHSTAAGVFVKAGARDEADDVAGVSHFLEHMAFKGDADAGWEQVNRAFDDLGALSNAYTSHEVTCYHGQVLPERAGELLHWLGRLTRPALRGDDFETERKVILEEIAMCNDDPGHRVYEAAAAAHFGGHGLGRSILGPSEIIERITPQQMAEYHAARYGAAAVTVAVTGVVNWPAVVELAEREWSGWPTGDPAPRTAPPATGGETIELADEKLTRAYTLLTTPGPSSTDDARWAARVLGDVLGDDEGSRLYWALVDPAVAEEAEFGWAGYEQAGMFYLSIVADPEATERSLAIAAEEIERAATAIEPGEVERVKAKLGTLLALGAESPAGRMRALGGDWLTLGRHRSTADLAARLAAVTVEEVRAAAAGVDLERATRVTLSR